MRKRLFFLMIVWFGLIPARGFAGESNPRGLFVTVLQDHFPLESRNAMNQLLDFAEEARIQTLFIQIYRANKSWVPSEVADASPYADCLKVVGEDPLALLIQKAHARKIQVHAWLNMLTLSDNKNARLLQKYGPEILTRNEKPKKVIEDYKIDHQYFLEPGDLRVRSEMLHLVREILSRYPELDGIQFDYIRYPDPTPAYGHNPANLRRFQEAHPGMPAEESHPVWRQWKRDQVTELLKALVYQARRTRPGIQVSATGCMNYIRAYEEAFQDWAGWIDKGLIDFVTVMSYTRKPEKFQNYLVEMKSKTKRWDRVNVGVGAYELIPAPEKFEQQFSLCEHAGDRACVVFHYGSLLENKALMSPLLSEIEPRIKTTRKNL